MKKRIKKLSEVPHAIVGMGQQGAVVLGKGVKPKRQRDPNPAIVAPKKATR